MQADGIIRNGRADIVLLAREMLQQSLLAIGGGGGCASEESDRAAGTIRAGDGLMGTGGRWREQGHTSHFRTFVTAG
jgi:hypothetical protein